MKHLLSFSLLLLALLLPASAMAHDFEVDGIYYNINGNEATVTFQGSEYYNPHYEEYFGHVIIPERVTWNGITYPVTAIGERAFASCQDLISVTCSNTITEIGKDAFNCCNGLTNIYFGNGLKVIGEAAFNHCISLASADIPNSVTTINRYAFWQCHSLADVTIGNSVDSIGSSAFEECTSLRSIHIPASVSFLLNTAFSGCSSLSSITVASDNPFFDSRDNCNAIIVTSSNRLRIGCQNTIIPNTVTSIGPLAFEKCTGLTAIDIPNSVKSIDSGAFMSCTNLTNVTIPNSLTKISSGAFASCSSLTSIDLPASVTTIEMAAFTGTGLTEIELPNRLLTLGERAFSNCSSLTAITIPASVTSIGKGLLNQCDAMNSITVESGNQYYDSRDGCNAIIETASNKLITGCISTVIPNTVTAIGEDAFYYCISLTDVTIPEGVTSIDKYAFWHCEGLTSLTLPNSVTTIGEHAFCYCTSMTSVTIPSSVTAIGERAFGWGNEQIDFYCYITDPSSVNVGSMAFYRYPKIYENHILHVPAGSLEAYQADTRWSDYFGSIVEMEPNPVIPGDLSGDGVLGVSDITMLINMIIGSDESTEFPPEADLNGDGKVDISDITLLVNQILSMPQ